MNLGNPTRGANPGTPRELAAAAAAKAFGYWKGRGGFYFGDGMLLIRRSPLLLLLSSKRTLNLLLC